MKNYLLCCMALLISATALVVSLFRNSSWDVDYPSLLVSVLSVLVTLLIGWNIYSLVDFNHRKKELKDITEDTSKKLNDYMIGVERSLWYLYFYLYIGKSPQGLPFEFIHHGLRLAYHFSAKGEVEKCDIIFNAIIKSLSEPQSISMSEISKEQILKEMLELRSQEHSSLYQTLLEKIVLLTTKKKSQ